MFLLLNKNLPLQLGVNKIVTGHNADDIAETVISNFEKPFLCFGFLVFTVPVGWFHNARLRRIMILNNFLTLRWSWTSCEATWRGSRGVRRSQPLARRWYQGGTSLYVLYFIKVEPLFLAAMIVCALWWETRKKQEHVVCIIYFHLQGANRSSTHTRRR